jgi:hypothetical protein
VFRLANSNLIRFAVVTAIRFRLCVFRLVNLNLISSGVLRLGPSLVLLMCC